MDMFALQVLAPALKQARAIYQAHIALAPSRQSDVVLFDAFIMCASPACQTSAYMSSC